ncbi:MAG: ATP-binding cassette domain-containing protein [Clostridiales bacterium]|nr:ATP-binding cassette domain-containing protein [Clostridiales bacterium]
MIDITFSHTSKVYDDDKGLFDLSMQLPQGESFGLLGPTGAGKSTALSLLMGFIRPDEGEVNIRGMDCVKRHHDIMKFVGFVPKDARLPKRTTGDEFIRLMAKARGSVGRSHMQQLMEKLDINPLGDWAYMSLESKRKVVIFLAFMHGPEILLLDDPCAGLDANGRNAVLDLIDEQRKKGKTILMTSHVFEEVQRSCDRVGIIREGRLVTVQSAKSLQYTRQKVYHITFESIDQASAFSQEWETGVELLRNRVIVAIPGSPQVLLSTLSKYTVLDLVGGREEMDANFLRSFGGDLI